MMKIREKLEQTEWAAELAEALREELDAFMKSDGFRIPEEPGGWWHQYVCPEHHTELMFDPLEADAAEFRCPYGCRLSGEPYRGAWLVYKHQSLARYALQAAAVYAATGEARYAELGRTVLERYARQFPRYPVHPDAQPWMLKGRAFHQALTEAIWATTLIRAYLMLREEGIGFGDAEEPLALFFEMLEDSMTQYRQVLIHERGKPESNYTAWLNAALACVYAAQDDQCKLEGLLSGEGGVRHHLSIGVKPDQFEFEGSTYYHVFVLRAYLISAEMAERFGIDIFALQGDRGQTFEGMFDVLAGLADDRGFLPALHDGPYHRLPYAREIAEIFEIGLARCSKPAYIPILAEAYRQMRLESGWLEKSGGAPGLAKSEGSGMEHEREASGLAKEWRNSLEGLVFGEGDADPAQAQPKRSSLWLPDSGFAVGRVAGNPLSFLADFGEHGGSHGHYDKLHISLNHTSGEPIAPEFGVVPYGSALRKGWYAETSSHNTVTVGGRSQEPHTGEAVKWSASSDAVYLWMRSTDAYPGCLLQRHVLQTDTFVLDWFDVELEGAPQTIDWWYHGAGLLELRSGAWEPSAGESLGREAGYGFVNVQGKASGSLHPGMLEMKQTATGGTELSIQLWTHPESAVYRIDTPGPADDPTRRTPGLLHRLTAAKASFVVLYQATAKPTELHFDDADLSPGAGCHWARAGFTVRTESGDWQCAFNAEEGIRFAKK